MLIPRYEPFYLPTLEAMRAEIGRLALDISLDENLAVLSTPHAGVANRFCAQPISGADAGPGGIPGPLTRHRYRRLAAGGFGLVWIESTAVGPAAPAGKLRLHDDTVGEFRKLIEELRAAAPQALTVILQLGIHATDPLPADSAIHAHLAALEHAAALAQLAGCDGVDVQACHGSLPAALLAAFCREGEFGGPLENRGRFLMEAVSRIRSICPDILTAVRLCAFEPAGFGADASDYRRDDLREPRQLAAMLRAAGLDFLNVTTASPRLRGPAAERKSRPFTDHDAPDEHPLQVLERQLRIAGSLRAAAPGLPVIGSGFSWLREFLPEVAAAAVAGATMDFVGLGRGALACPDAAARIMRDGRLDPGKTCMVCFACNTLRANDDPVGCPIRDAQTYGMKPAAPRRIAPDQLAAQARRCHLCEAAPCVAASRTAMDIPAMIDAWRRSDERLAYETIRRSNVLPEMSARLTPGWLHSEGACIETALTGTPVPILDLQFEIAWQARHRGDTGVRLPAEPSTGSVAVVGAGPAGLAASIRLLEHGHQVDLYERSATLGGTPERVIPTSRFPSARPEIDAILAPAIAAGRLRIHHGMTLGATLELGMLCSNSDAVLLAAGVWQERKLPGARRVDGVVDALGFLTSVKSGARTGVPQRVAILAGGDCAMDAARCAELLGAKDIFIVFGGLRSEMHWHMSDDWFAGPGHHAMMECRASGYVPGPDNRLAGLRIHQHGQERTLETGLVIEAMGLQITDALRRNLTGIDINEHGLITLTHGALTSRPGVYAAGGLVNGGASVARCIAEGLAAAHQIHQALER
jgi:NADPH-dependent glutamate synthase beta subunit-like oxidoreductase/2,4-dienoyl-CoA reductase-like NADH-dependent reductase (Old Yellow Enzyme family)